MTKSTYNPNHVQELGKLVNYIAKLHKATRDKSQWPSLYPALLVLSERLSTLNNNSSSLFQWLLSCELTQFPYATRLHIKRIAALACLTKSQGYQAKDCQLMMMAILSADLSVLGVINKRAQNTPLSEREVQQLQRSTLLSIKMLDINAQQHPALVQILAKSKQYQRIITNKQNAQLYDGYTRMVALAQLLGNYTTATATKEGVHFFNACAYIYKITRQTDIQSLCTQIIEYLSPQLLGSYSQRGDQCFIYMGQHPDNEHVFSDLRTDKPRYRIIKQPHWQYVSQCEIYDDVNDLLERVGAPVQRLSKASQRTVDNRVLVQQLSQAHSYSEIEKCVADHPQLIERIMQEASAYNRTYQSAGTLRHALSMVGLYKVGDFITRVLLEQQVQVLKHPLAAFIKARVDCTHKLVAFMSEKMQNVYSERLSALYLCYFNYFIQEAGTKLSRTSALDPLKLPFDEHAPRPIAALLGVTEYDKEALRAYLVQHIGESEWVTALIQSEQLPFNELNTNARICFTFKLVLFHLYGHGHSIEPWQQQLVKNTMIECQGPSIQLETLITQALSIAPYNGV
ncbi:hypothetical protein [Pseudoalteromonas pernae]|uniref:hypothetical protein n=1 Tax=Pseudoalteromonas pernae TaxID=3118054 RepID=UPI003241E01B